MFCGKVKLVSKTRARKDHMQTAANKWYVYRILCAENCGYDRSAIFKAKNRTNADQALLNSLRYTKKDREHPHETMTTCTVSGKTEAAAEKAVDLLGVSTNMV